MSATWPGVATPIVSLTATSNAPIASSRSVNSTTRACGTLPSNGQPNAVER